MRQAKRAKQIRKPQQRWFADSVIVYKYNIDLIQCTPMLSWRAPPIKLLSAPQTRFNPLFSGYVGRTFNMCAMYRLLRLYLFFGKQFPELIQEPCSATVYPVWFNIFLTKQVSINIGAAVEEPTSLMFQLQPKWDWHKSCVTHWSANISLAKLNQGSNSNKLCNNL